MGEAVNNSTDSESRRDSKALLSWCGCEKGAEEAGPTLQLPSLGRVLRVRRDFFRFFQQKLD